MTIPTMWNEGGPSGQGYSEIETYLRCPKEHQLANIRKLSKPQNQVPDYFAVGSFMHAGRARWFAEQFGTSDETWEKIRADVTACREGMPLPCSDESEAVALRYLQEYVDHWMVREKPNIVAVEHMLGPVNIEGDGTPRTARLDDFGFYPEAGMKLMIGECKTTSGAISDVMNQYTLHGQPALQKLLWGLAPQGEATYGAVGGMVLDVIKKGYGGKRCEFARMPIPVPERLTRMVAHEFAAAIRARDRLNWDSPAERRFTSCTRLIGKARVACAYRDVCLTGRPAVIGMVLENNRPVSEWQPSEGQTVNPWD